MKTPEQLALQYMGIRKESPRTKTWAVLTLYLLSEANKRINHPQIIGKTPPQYGPMIWIANHTSALDAVDAFEAARVTTGRFLIPVVKRSLVDPFFKESEKIEERTGKKESTLGKLLSLPQACMMRNLGVVDIDRGNPGRTFFEDTDAVLNAGQMLGIFPQETRNKDGLLRNLMVGAVALGRRHPEIPIIPMGISVKQDGRRTINIGAAFTYEKLLAERSVKRLNPAEGIVAMVDRIGLLLPPRVQQDWTKERERLLAA